MGCIELRPAEGLTCATQSGRLPVLLHGQGCRAFSQRPGHYACSRVAERL